MHITISLLFRMNIHRPVLKNGFIFMHAFKTSDPPCFPRRHLCGCRAVQAAAVGPAPIERQVALAGTSRTLSKSCPHNPSLGCIEEKEGATAEGNHTLTTKGATFSAKER